MSIPRFLRSAFAGYEIFEIKECLSEQRICLWVKAEENKEALCHRCRSPIHCDGKYLQKIQCMPVMGLRVEVTLTRRRGYCKGCKKSRAELVEWLSEETPHLSDDYAHWLGKLAEFAPISRAAKLMGLDSMTLWRVDFEQMKRRLQNYKIPSVTHLSVDEVYVVRRQRGVPLPREKRFFTIVSDLKTKKVIWVSEGRSKAALDQFYILIGKEACKKIQAVAMDQFDGYSSSTAEHCPRATIVWDRFHLMQNLGEIINETRLQLHSEFASGSPLHRLTRGKYKYIYLKKASRRTQHEKRLIEDVTAENEYFLRLELIKERMFQFFNAATEEEAKHIFDEVGEWIYRSGFTRLMDWHNRLERSWSTLKNYFRHRITSATSEGINNVIKALIRRAYGYRNMHYFKLKIMQVCGYLNSQFCPLMKSTT
ncbi:MAG: ISL3 family transposase [Xanthomonadaceae bacterium]|nr:ISL3 family transposase [Xanthomonadaceae bacterium]MCM0606835.1 ISL3 family transposase [Xanthomonadaceae bacterium]